MNWEAFKKMTFKQKLFVIFIITPMLLLFIGLTKALMSKTEERRKYKKVIKKGILWDTEYLIEK